jgi:hypothetical protein
MSVWSRRWRAGQSAPGGSVDAVARLELQCLGEQLNQSFVIENVAGASGTIGTQRAARVAADGYALRDFAPVAPEASSPFVPIGSPQVLTDVVVGGIELAVMPLPSSPSELDRSACAAPVAYSKTMGSSMDWQKSNFAGGLVLPSAKRARIHCSHSSLWVLSSQTNLDERPVPIPRPMSKKPQSRRSCDTSSLTMRELDLFST